MRRFYLCTLSFLRRAARSAALCAVLGLTLCSCLSINRSAAALRLPPALVVFTFDDGPNAHEDATVRLLAVLKKHNITAAFALLGANAERYPDLTRRIAAEGHLIVNHGYSDKFAFRMNEREFADNLRAGEAAILRPLGHGDLAAGTPSPSSIRFYRPQGGFYTKAQQRLWQREGYTLAPATVRAYDAVKTGAARALVRDRVLAKAKKENGGIILLHDAREVYTRQERHLSKHPAGPYNRAWLPETVEEIIAVLKQKGFILTGFAPASVFASGE